MRHFFIIGLTLFFSSNAFAQHNGHPPEHQALHNQFYSKLKIPTTQMSCCNDKDCRPARHRMRDGWHEFHVKGKWIKVGKSLIIDDRITPDGRSHWCGIYFEGQVKPTTYCGIVAPQLF